MIPDDKYCKWFGGTYMGGKRKCGDRERQGGPSPHGLMSGINQAGREVTSSACVMTSTDNMHEYHINSKGTTRSSPSGD